MYLKLKKKSLNSSQKFVRYGCQILAVLFSQVLFQFLGTILLLILLSADSLNVL